MEHGQDWFHKPAKILANCGTKQVGRITSGEKGVTMTAIVQSMLRALIYHQCKFLSENSE